MGRKNKRRTAFKALSVDLTQSPKECPEGSPKSVEALNSDGVFTPNLRKALVISDFDSSSNPRRASKSLNPNAEPFIVTEIPMAGPFGSVVFPSVANNISSTFTGSTGVSTWKDREKLLPCLMGRPDHFHPRFVLDRKIVNLLDKDFSAGIASLSPFWSGLYKDARENRDGIYCYAVSDGMRMIPLISKMIFPLTVVKLVQHYHYDKNEHPLDKILIMEQKTPGNYETVQYVQVYLEDLDKDSDKDCDKIRVPTGVYQVETSYHYPHFRKVFSKEEWNDFRASTIEMVRDRGGH